MPRLGRERTNPMIYVLLGVLLLLLVVVFAEAVGAIDLIPAAENADAGALLIFGVNHA